MTNLKFDSKLHKDMYNQLEKLVKEDLKKQEAAKEVVDYMVVDPTKDTTGYEWLLFSISALFVVGLLYGGLRTLYSGAANTTANLLEAFK